MIKIELTNASNGIIKKVIDTQFNGANQKAEITTIYEIDEDHDDKYQRTIEFLDDISKDLGLDLGSDYSDERIIMNVEWGKKYNPNLEEVNEYLSWLRNETRRWRDYKKIIQNNIDVDNG